jgi:GT2 family glycosyltransferase
MISIIIPNYNGEHFLEECLSSVASQTLRDFETIFIDNASVDGSVAFVKERYPWVRIVEKPENLGFAGGTNAGIRETKGEYILTLNNDTRLESDFLEEMVTAIKTDENIGMVAPKMLLMDGRINATGMCISRSGAAWNRGMFEEDVGQYENPEHMIGACAGAALYRREMFNDIGLFDEDFFLYHEDVDLSFRAFLAGWDCLYWPNAVVWHVNSGTLGFESDNCVYYGNRNIIWFVVKSYPTWLLISSIPWIVGRNVGVIFHYLLCGKFRVALKAKIDAIKGLNLSIQKRNMIIKKIPYREISQWIYTWYTPRG